MLRCARNDDERSPIRRSQPLVRPCHHAPVLPDGARIFRKIRNPLIRLNSATVHGVVFEGLTERKQDAPVR